MVSPTTLGRPEALAAMYSRTVLRSQVPPYIEQESLPHSSVTMPESGVSESNEMAAI